MHNDIENYGKGADSFLKRVCAGDILSGRSRVFVGIKTYIITMGPDVPYLENDIPPGYSRKYTDIIEKDSQWSIYGLGDSSTGMVNDKKFELRMIASDDHDNTEGRRPLPPEYFATRRGVNKAIRQREAELEKSGMRIWHKSVGKWDGERYARMK